MCGEVEIKTSKNAVLPILAASILCDGVVKINNFPYYTDAINMVESLRMLGAKVFFEEESLVMDNTNITAKEIPATIAVKTRSSIFTLGAILGRFKKARVAYPGGCDIGARPIDLHLKGLEKLSVKIVDKHGYITCDGKNLKGGVVNLDFPSVGATENIMLASVLAKGKTKIINPAKEPEIEDLQNFLNSAGAKIKGAGTNVITITGVDRLGSVTYTPISDRIIAGTYMLATAICGGEVMLRKANAKHLDVLIDKITESNPRTKIISKNGNILVKSKGDFKAVGKIETMPYPGFPTDLQPQIATLLTTAKGTSLIVENLFETRYKYTAELSKMGANIIVKDRHAIISGVEKLYGAQVQANDLRGGASLVLAGLMADGYTTILNSEHISRGYEHIENDLATLGADIQLID